MMQRISHAHSPGVESAKDSASKRRVFAKNSGGVKTGSFGPAMLDNIVSYQASESDFSRDLIVQVPTATGRKKTITSEAQMQLDGKQED